LLAQAGRLTSLLHRRKQQRHQHADDGNDHQQFNQRKGRPPQAASRSYQEQIHHVIPEEAKAKKGMSPELGKNLYRRKAVCKIIF
jgi:hypothetical protein